MDKDLETTFTNEDLHVAFTLHHMSANGGVQPPPAQVWKFVLQQIQLEMDNEKDVEPVSQPVLHQLHRSQLGKRVNVTSAVELTEFTAQIDTFDTSKRVADLMYGRGDYASSSEAEEDEEETIDEDEQIGSKEIVVQFDMKVEGLWGKLELRVCMSSASGYELSYQVIGILRYFRGGTIAPDHWEEDLQRVRSGSFGEYFRETKISELNEARLRDMLVEYRKHVLAHQFRSRNELYETIHSVEFKVEDWIQPSGALLKWAVCQCFEISQRFGRPLPCVGHENEYQQRILQELTVQACGLPQSLESESELVVSLTREAVALANVFWKEVLAIPEFLTWRGRSLLVWSHFLAHLQNIQRRKEMCKYMVQRQKYLYRPYR